MYTRAGGAGLSWNTFAALKPTLNAQTGQPIATRVPLPWHDEQHNIDEHDDQYDDDDDVNGTYEVNPVSFMPGDRVLIKQGKPYPPWGRGPFTVRERSSGGYMVDGGLVLRASHMLPYNPDEECDYRGMLSPEEIAEYYPNGT